MREDGSYSVRSAPDGQGNQALLTSIGLTSLADVVASLLWPSDGHSRPRPLQGRRPQGVADRRTVSMLATVSPLSGDGAMTVGRWRGALSALVYAVLAWAAPAAVGYLLADASSPQRLAALAVAVVAVAVVGCVAAGTTFSCLLAGISFTSRATALREKSWRVAFLPQRDPDAAGRPRPRAPGTAPAAA
jgi:hypothetical protein